LLHIVADFFTVDAIYLTLVDRYSNRSAYYPHANKRAEVGVKSAKHLVMDNLGPGGSLDTDKSFTCPPQLS
jgi:hypothetical protein